jgi:hypothetical protein
MRQDINRSGNQPIDLSIDHPGEDWGVFLPLS